MRKFSKAAEELVEVWVLRADGVRQRYHIKPLGRLQDGAPVGKVAVLRHPDGDLRTLIKIANLRPDLMPLCATEKQSVWFDVERIEKDRVTHKTIIHSPDFAARILADPERITIPEADPAYPARYPQRRFFKPGAELSDQLTKPSRSEGNAVLEFFASNRLYGYNFIRSTFLKKRPGEEEVIWQRTSR